DNDRVVIEPNRRPIRSAVFLGRSHDHRFYHVALLHRSVRSGRFHGSNNHVADLRVFLVPVENANDEDLSGSRVIRYPTARIWANHGVATAGCVWSMMGMSSWPLLISRATTQCFSRLSGRLSRISTVSPMW